MAKHRLRNAWRSIRAKSKLSLPQVAATSLAAITMAIVSARLTSFSSSILIVGVISAISAFASEFYRIVITASAETTKKKVVPILEGELLSGSHSESDRSADAGTTADSVDATGVQDQLGATVVSPAPLGATSADGGVSGKPARPSAAGARLVGDTTADASDLGEPDPRTPEKRGEGASGESGRRRPFLYALMHNQLLQMSLIFLVVALLTVGVSYAVARAQGKTEINNSYTTVQQSLSEEDKQQITEEAAAKAREEAAKNQAGTPTTQTQEIPTDTDLQTQVDALKAENESLQTSISDLTALLEAEQARTDELAARLAALEQQQGQQTPDADTVPTG